MIAVAIHPDRLPAASEFFELFKTEWEIYRPGNPCNILLTDGTAPPDVSTQLYLIFTPEQQLRDRFSADQPDPQKKECRVTLPDGTELPVYTKCKRFNNHRDALITETQNGQTIAYAEYRPNGKTIRVGYDLFDEISYLISTGQPPENAAIPALDLHIQFFRTLILQSGLDVIEIPPCPPNHPYMVCLTHDVDFVSIRAMKLNTSFQGFAKRALFGSIQRVFTGQLSLRQVFQNIDALLSIPLIHLGLRKDFWMQFDSYRRLEEPHHSTFFLIPYKNRPGQEVTMPHPGRRAAQYDVTDICKEVQTMQENGWEFGLHGIDAWHDADFAFQEKDRLTTVLHTPCTGTRTHWLCNNEQTPKILDEAGFEYDSSFGYNETIGFRAGTSQVFQPLQARQLLEIPLIIQDVALFYPTSLNLHKKEAARRCEEILAHPRKNGGVLTILWHMRSIAPERLWGDFYKRLLDTFTNDGAWFGTAGETAEWFRGRREIRLSSHVSPEGERVVRMEGERDLHKKITLRIHHRQPLANAQAEPFTDIIWDGKPEIHTGIYETPDIEQTASTG